MHGYCHCKECIDEYYGRHGYNIGDDDTAPRRSKRPKNKIKREGCPANNGGKHIYVWVEYHATYISPWSKKWQTSIYWHNECVGCKRRSIKWAHTRPHNVYAVIETDSPGWYY